ncbi:MAG TPA: response regulator [Elusimicrobiales bacterium]|nr:response regulator [Elusimicrobiales bacterium]
MKILVADDEPLIVELMTEYLSAAGHAVVSTDNAATLVQMVLADAPELIFLDINMPGIRDVIISPKIKIPQEIRHIPIVAITGNEPEKLYAAGLPETIPVLKKPIDFDEVDAKIKEITG